jgi:hypothetical protein
MKILKQNKNSGSALLLNKECKQLSLDSFLNESPNSSAHLPVLECKQGKDSQLVTNDARVVNLETYNIERVTSAFAQVFKSF